MVRRASEAREVGKAEGGGRKAEGAGSRKEFGSQETRKRKKRDVPGGAGGGFFRLVDFWFLNSAAGLRRGRKGREQEGIRKPGNQEAEGAGRAWRLGRSFFRTRGFLVSEFSRRGCGGEKKAGSRKEFGSQEARKRKKRDVPGGAGGGFFRLVDFWFLNSAAGLQRREKGRKQEGIWKPGNQEEERGFGSGFPGFLLLRCILGGFAPGFLVSEFLACVQFGRRTVKRAPPPGASSRVMVPRWASTMALTMLRPRPRPRWERLASPR